MYVCLSVCMYASLHFPFAPQHFSQKTRFFLRFRKEDVQKHRVFSDFRQKDAGSPSQQKSRQGESSLGLLFCDTGSPKTTFSGTSSNCRAVLGGGPPPVSDVGSGGLGGGGYPLSSLRCPDTPSNVGGYSCFSVPRNFLGGMP